MFQYKLTLAYDGTHYFGWQKTKSGPSIQEKLEQALLRIGETAPLPEAASRTDRGVHAEGQVAALVLQKSWDLLKLQKALNGALFPSIQVVHIEIVPLDFHPTLQAIEKEYHYYLCIGAVQRPMDRLYSWHLHYPLDLEKMKEGAEKLVGTHDFTSFANAPKENPFCTLHSIAIAPWPEKRLRIAIRGDRFLYKMARNIVGTLISVGRGKIASEKLPFLIQSQDRKQTGMTAPAHGLTLHRVRYT
jgi:tRNA pseudouridine38-40 synthase